MYTSPKVLLLGVPESGIELPEVAEMVFRALELTHYEMRESENHENGRYFAGYAANACLHVDDFEDLMEGEYRFQLTIERPHDWTQSAGHIPESLEAIAEILARANFNVFEPTENWYDPDWDGSGRKYRV